MLKLGFEPVEVMLTPPLAAPLVVGEKSTVKDVLWPAVNVKGKDSPLKLNPVPLAAAAEMVRLDPPVLVSVSDRLLLLPTWTLPNAKLEGLGESTPAVTPVPVPVPERLSTTVLFVWFAVVAKVTLPLKFPAPVGANVIVAEAEPSDGMDAMFDIAVSDAGVEAVVPVPEPVPLPVLLVEDLSAVSVLPPHAARNTAHMNAKIENLRMIHPRSTLVGVQ